jgi:hypothetical protein
MLGLLAAAIVSSVIDFLENLRIDTAAPSIASGGMMMLTRQPRVDQRPRLVDAAADPRHDLCADVHQVLLVAERDVGQLHFALALGVDLLWPVDHNVADRLVGEQRFQRSQPEHVGDQRFDELALFGEVQLDFGLGEQLLDPAGQLRLKGGAGHFRRRRDIHVFEHQRLDLRFCRFDRRLVGVAAIG